jgi:hypothetical protein
VLYESKIKCEKKIVGKGELMIVNAAGIKTCGMDLEDTEVVVLTALPAKWKFGREVAETCIRDIRIPLRLPASGGEADSAARGEMREQVDVVIGKGKQREVIISR